MSVFYGIGINTFRILTISLIFSAFLFSQEHFIPVDMDVMIGLAVGKDANIGG